MIIGKWNIKFSLDENNYEIFIQKNSEITAENLAFENVEYDKYLIEYHNHKSPNSKIAIIYYDNIYDLLCIETFSGHMYKIDSETKTLHVLPPLHYHTINSDGSYLKNV